MGLLHTPYLLPPTAILSLVCEGRQQCVGVLGLVAAVTHEAKLSSSAAVAIMLAVALGRVARALRLESHTKAVTENIVTICSGDVGA
eukprot:SAG11_NODE_4711_length_1796_cov_1.532705_1_plen_86_part_10